MTEPEDVSRVWGKPVPPRERSPDWSWLGMVLLAGGLVALAGYVLWRTW